LLSEKAGISWKEKGRTAFCIKEEARHLLRSRSTGERHPEDGSASKHFQMRIFFSQERAILQSTLDIDCSIARPEPTGYGFSLTGADPLPFSL